MYKRLKISHHQHSGRLRPHEHTSYLPLAILLLVVGVLLGASSLTALSSADVPPQAGSVGLNGVMPGEPPQEAAIITAPVSGQRFSTSPITVAGTCPSGTLVEVFKNNIFAGSSPCSDSGTFSFEIDLLIGQNNLVAKVYDALNQSGPDSNEVTVFYDALPPQAGSLAPLDLSSQLLLNTDAVYRGVFPDQELVVPVEIIGGLPPFALNVQWGDSNNKVVPRNDNQPFRVSHTYRRPGTYQITLQASDAQGRTAFLTVASIVNGQLATTTGGSVTPESVNKLIMLWPLYTATVAIMISFWLGERREKHILTGHTPNTPLQA